jgi:hypothetical protein
MKEMESKKSMESNASIRNTRKDLQSQMISAPSKWINRRRDLSQSLRIDECFSVQSLICRIQQTHRGLRPSSSAQVRPTRHAGAGLIEGHPSCSFGLCYDTDSSATEPRFRVGRRSSRIRKFFIRKICVTLLDKRNKTLTMVRVRCRARSDVIGLYLSWN